MRGVVSEIGAFKKGKLGQLRSQFLCHDGETMFSERTGRMKQRGKLLPPENIMEPRRSRLYSLPWERGCNIAGKEAEPLVRNEGPRSLLIELPDMYAECGSNPTSKGWKQMS